MKAFSSVASITVHVGVVGAVLLGGAKAGRSDPPRPRELSIVFRPLERSYESGAGLVLPNPVSIPPIDVRFIPAPALPNTGGTTATFSPFLSSPHSGSGSDPSTGWGGVASEAQPEVLSGPVPVYPGLLRQAGVPGEGLVEAGGEAPGGGGGGSWGRVWGP